MLASCAGPTFTSRRNADATVVGGALGAGAGAVTGWAICGPGCGWGGAAIGGATGAIAGNLLTR